MFEKCHRWSASALFVLIGLALAPPALGQPSSGPPPKTYDYEVQKGDTCVSIARKELGDSKAYHEIHRLNPDMGPTPHTLNPGELLKMPLPQHPEAEVTATENKVQAKPGQLGAWAKADPGLAMYRGWRIQTLESSFADLRFVDTSTVSLAPNTMVVIYGAYRKQKSNIPARASLDHGRLRARLAELGGQGGTLDLVTPSSNAHFEGGETLVEVSQDGLSRIENHGDGVAQVSGTGQRSSLRLPKSTGTKVRKGQKPSPPQALPTTPQWDGKNQTTFATESRGAKAWGSWQGVPRAVAYRVELLKYDGSGREPHSMKVMLQDAASPRYQLHDLRPGRYAVKVAAIDKEDFTSIPSAAQQFEIHKVELHLDGQPLPMPNEIGAAVQVPHGASLAIPKEAQCMSPSIGLAHPEGLITQGRHQVFCKQSNGQAMKPWTLVVDPPAPRLRSNQRVKLLRGEKPADPLRQRPVFDLGVGSSVWILQRGNTDVLAVGSNQLLPTVFFDIHFRYLPLPWLAVGVNQHLSSPRSYQRNASLMLGASANVDFIHHKWRFSPFVGLHAGVVGLVGASRVGVKTQTLPLGVDVGVRAPVVRGLSVQLRAGVMRIMQSDLSSMYTSAKLSLAAAYRFGAM